MIWDMQQLFLDFIANSNFNLLIHAVFVEKILRVQPNVEKLYLLVRASTADSATDRMHNEVLKINSTLRSINISNHIVYMY